ncbi:MAG: alpha/beta hydrolase [Coriobacteriia bacterium]|nr:alpha/beta hydrolase [Coriobacteriia bacterium]
MFQTDKGPIAYWVGGAAVGPELVFLPGLTADRRLFDQQVEHFAPACRCLVWDPPAHGESRPFPLEFTLDDWARWLREILARESFAHPILVGQSMGGYLSQAFMRLFPGVVAGFASIDSAPLERSYYAGWELWALRHTRLMYLSISWKMLLTWGSTGTAESEHGRALMRTMMEGYGKREYCELAAHGYRMLADAAGADCDYPLTCPVELICGEKDAAGSTRRYNRAWTERTGLPLTWVPGAGHNSNTDRPDEVNAVIQRLIDRVAAGR